MRKIVSAATAVLLLTGLGTTVLPATAQAEPGGCLKYGAVGAVGGHLAHHGVLGAAGGCAAGMYKRHVYRRSQRAAAQNSDMNNATNTVTQ